MTIDDLAKLHPAAQCFACIAAAAIVWALCWLWVRMFS